MSVPTGPSSHSRARRPGRLLRCWPPGCSKAAEARALRGSRQVGPRVAGGCDAAGAGTTALSWLGPGRGGKGHPATVLDPHIQLEDTAAWDRPPPLGAGPRLTGPGAPAGAGPDGALACRQDSTPLCSWTTPAAPRSRCAAAPTSVPSSWACEQRRRPLLPPGKRSGGPSDG